MKPVENCNSNPSLSFTEVGVGIITVEEVQVGRTLNEVVTQVGRTIDPLSRKIPGTHSIQEGTGEGEIVATPASSLQLVVTDIKNN